MVDAAQEYESAKTMERQRKADEREERLSAFKGQRITPTSPSDFHHRGISELRALVEHANPDAIENSGSHWRASADRLGGQDGRGGIRKAFMDAVDHASAHWQGSAAEAFRREALKVLDKVDRTYGHARVVERTLIGTRESGPETGVAHNLREAKKTMSGIKDPGKVDSALDDSGDDAQFHRDMANPKMDARMALELNRDSLSLSKERQVEAVIVMDELAANYEGHAEAFWSEGTDPGGVKGDWPKHPSSSAAPPPVNMPVIGGPRPKPSSGDSEDAQWRGRIRGAGRLRRPQDQPARAARADRTRQCAGRHHGPADERRFTRWWRAWRRPRRERRYGRSLRRSDPRGWHRRFWRRRGFRSAWCRWDARRRYAGRRGRQQRGTWRRCRAHRRAGPYPRRHGR